MSEFNRRYWATIMMGDVGSCALCEGSLYLDVPDELLGGGLDGHLAVDGPLYGGRPPHGLVQHLGVQAVRVLAPVDDDVPVACVRSEGCQTDGSILGSLPFDTSFRG